MSPAEWVGWLSVLLTLVTLAAYVVKVLNAVKAKAREMGHQSAVDAAALKDVADDVKILKQQVSILKKEVKQVQNWLHKNTEFVIRDLDVGDV